MPIEAAGRLMLPAIVGVLLFGATAQAQGPSVRVELEPPETISEGDRTTVIASVTVNPASERPVLVTPSAEGTAVEVVQGRLLRADAEDPDAEVLRFRIRLVARRRGTGVVRVRVQAWSCEDEVCREVRSETRIVLRVSAPS